MTRPPMAAARWSTFAISTGSWSRIGTWSAIRKGTVEVVFPSGFRSQARPLKVDKDWDLAALVIWRPPIEPVRVSAMPPQPGDLLTIHGYGQGQYRIATGHCTAVLRAEGETSLRDGRARRRGPAGRLGRADLQRARRDRRRVVRGRGGDHDRQLRPAGANRSWRRSPRTSAAAKDRRRWRSPTARPRRPSPRLRIDPCATAAVASATRELEAQLRAWPSSPWMPGKTPGMDTPSRQRLNRRRRQAVEAVAATAGMASRFPWSRHAVEPVGIERLEVGAGAWWA